MSDPFASSRVRTKIDNPYPTDQVDSEKTTVTKVQAKWEYTSEEPEHLTFPAGAIIDITIQDANNSGWWEGTCEGKKGIFPINRTMVYEIEKNVYKSLRLKTPASRKILALQQKINKTTLDLKANLQTTVKGSVVPTEQSSKPSTPDRVVSESTSSTEESKKSIPEENPVSSAQKKKKRTKSDRDAVIDFGTGLVLGDDQRPDSHHDDSSDSSDGSDSDSDSKSSRSSDDDDSEHSHSGSDSGSDDDSEHSDSGDDSESEGEIEVTEEQLQKIREERAKRRNQKDRRQEIVESEPEPVTDQPEPEPEPAKEEPSIVEISEVPVVQEVIEESPTELVTNEPVKEEPHHELQPVKEEESHSELITKGEPEPEPTLEPTPEPIQEETHVVQDLEVKEPESQLEPVTEVDQSQSVEISEVPVVQKEDIEEPQPHPISEIESNLSKEEVEVPTSKQPSDEDESESSSSSSSDDEGSSKDDHQDVEKPQEQVSSVIQLDKEPEPVPPAETKIIIEKTPLPPVEDDLVEYLENQAKEAESENLLEPEEPTPKPLKDLKSTHDRPPTPVHVQSGQSPDEIRFHDPNRADDLWTASEQGDLELVTELLEQGANVNKLNVHGSTALHCASKANQQAVILYLLAHGAQASILDANMRMPHMVHGCRKDTARVILRNLSTPPVWIPDNTSPSCLNCQATFTFWSRRHHCRNCGILACGTCTGKAIAIPKLYPGNQKTHRVCTHCYEALSQH